VRYLTIRFEVVDDCAMTDEELADLGDRIVAQQIDPDPPVLTFDGVEVEHG
jgi:hypothetical protein